MLRGVDPVTGCHNIRQSRAIMRENSHNFTHQRRDLVLLGKNPPKGLSGVKFCQFSFISSHVFATHVSPSPTTLEILPMVPCAPSSHASQWTEKQISVDGLDKNHTVRKSKNWKTKLHGRRVFHFVNFQLPFSSKTTTFMVFFFAGWSPTRLVKPDSVAHCCSNHSPHNSSAKSCTGNIVTRFPSKIPRGFCFLTRELGITAPWKPDSKDSNFFNHCFPERLRKKESRFQRIEKYGNRSGN